MPSSLMAGLVVPRVCREDPNCQSCGLSSSKHCGEKNQDTGPVKGTHLQRVLYEMWYPSFAGVPLKESHAHSIMKRGTESLEPEGLWSPSSNSNAAGNL